MDGLWPLVKTMYIAPLQLGAALHATIVLLHWRRNERNDFF